MIVVQPLIGPASRKILPIDYLKIDGSFVRDTVVDQVDRAIVASINQIGHVTKLKTIAEFCRE